MTEELSQGSEVDLQPEQESFSQQEDVVEQAPQEQESVESTAAEGDEHSRTKTARDYRNQYYSAQKQLAEVSRQQQEAHEKARRYEEFIAAQLGVTSPHAAAEEPSQEEAIEQVLDVYMQRREEKVKQQEISNRFQQSLTKELEKDPDFFESIEELAAKGSMPSHEALAQSAYHIENLGSLLNIARKGYAGELAAIAALPTAHQTIALVRLDEKIKSDLRYKSSAAAPAPKPITNGTGAGGNLSVNRPLSVAERRQRLEEEFLSKHK